MGEDKTVKSLKQFNENSNISDVSNCLLKCGFEQITEEEIKNYTGEEDDLTSYENENIYEFGYLYYDNYCIIKLNKNRNDSVLRYKDGSSNFIIRYNNKLYIGDSKDFDSWPWYVWEAIHTFFNELKAQNKE
jgi:hypothetical protein